MVDSIRFAGVVGNPNSGLAAGEQLVFGDDYSCNASFNNQRAGDNKTVNVNDIILTASSTAKNYVLSSSSSNFVLHSKPVAVYISLISTHAVAKNYALSGGESIGGSSSITPRTITISGAFIAPKEYDGADSSAVVDSVAFTGLVAGDTLTLETDYTASARFTTMAVGDDNEVEGSVTLAKTGTAANYTLESSTFTLSDQKIGGSIAIEIAGVTIAEKTYDGTDTAVLESITFKKAGGDSLLLIADDDYTLISSKFDGNNAGSGKTATVIISLTEDGKSKYTLADTSYTLAGQTIEKATPSTENFDITPAATDVTYDGAAHDFGFSVAWKPIYSDTGSIDVLYNGKEYWPSSAGAYPIDLRIAATGNFHAATVNVDTGVIAKKEIAVDSAILKAKTYNGAVTATVSQVIFTGVVPEDVSDFDDGIAQKIYKASAKFEDAGVGDNKKVAVTVSLIDANDIAKNYTIKDANKKGQVVANITGQSIAKKALTIVGDSIEISPKTYDGTKVATVADDTLTIDEGKFTGLVAGDTVYVVIDSARFNSANVASATKVTLYATPHGKNADSYTVKALALTGQTIAQATPTLAHLQFTPKDTTFVYSGSAVPAVAKPKVKTGLSGMGTISSVLYGDTTARPKEVGKYAVSVAVAGGANFLPDTVVLDTITIVQDTLEISSFTVGNRVYNGTDDAPVTKVAFKNASKVVALTLNTDYAVDSAKFGNKYVTGDSTVTVYVSLKPDGTKSKNYVLKESSYSAKAAMITPKSISIETATVAKTYDGTKDAKNDVTGVAFKGVVAGDTLAPGTDYAIDSAVFTSVDAGSGKTVQLYVSLAGVVKDNYTLSGSPKTLPNQTIAPRTIYFDSIFVAEKIYDGANTATVDSVTFTNLVPGEALGVGTDYRVDTAYFNDVNAGDDKMLALSISLVSNSATAKNYVPANPDTTVTRRIVKATPAPEHFAISDNDGVVYDGVNHPVAVALKGGYTKAGAISSLRYNGGTTQPKAAGDYAISVSVAGGDNFTAASTLVVDTLTIAKRPITIDTVAIGAKTYDGTDTARVTRVVRFGGLVNITSNTLTIATEYVIDSARFEDTKAGTDKDVRVYVRLTGGRSVNYVLDTTVFTQKHSVAQKKIAPASAVIAPKTYDGTNTAIVESVTFNNNALPGDFALLDTSWSVVSAYFTNLNAGAANRMARVKVALTGDAATNYLLSKDSCNVTAQTIEKATLTREHLVVTGTAINSGETANVAVTLKYPYTGIGTNVTVSYRDLDGNAAPSPQEVGKYLIVAAINAGTNFTKFTGVVDTLTIAAVTQVYDTS